MTDKQYTFEQIKFLYHMLGRVAETASTNSASHLAYHLQEQLYELYEKGDTNALNRIAEIGDIFGSASTDYEAIISHIREEQYRLGLDNHYGYYDPDEETQDGLNDQDWQDEEGEV